MAIVYGSAAIRRAALSLLCAWLWLGTLAGVCSGGEAVAGQADSLPPAFLDAWQAVRKGVLAGDLEALAAAARFPIKSLDYGQAKVRDGRDLARRFSTLFEPKLVELIRTGQCIPGPGDPGYEIDCANGYMIFGFEDTGAGYRLTYFGSINE